MNCTQFEEKIQSLLDQRLSLKTDSSLNEHAAACAGCRRSLSLYSRIAELGGLESGEIEWLPERLHQEPSIWNKKVKSQQQLWKLAALAGALMLGLILVARPSWVSTRLANIEPAVEAHHVKNGDIANFEVDRNWMSSFTYEISVKDLVPEWTLQLSDTANVDLPALDELNFLTLVPEAPVRAVRNIPTALAPIYYYSVELPFVNRLSDQIYCTISLIQTSFGIVPGNLNAGGGDLGCTCPLDKTCLC